MREIKFRAWYKGSIGQFEEIEWNRVHRGKRNIRMNDWEDICDNLVLDECMRDKNYVVMQYTGLKDKNGKEIYEGDIVKVTDDNDEISELNSDTGIGAIEWLDKWGFWNISRIENSLGDINNSYEIEVIGNIYENKELLEVV